MNIKLTQFIKRNKKRNVHLYKNGVVEGYDYVICPISGERLSMIKENYITNILGMVVEEYPITQRICNKRKENIQQGLKQIDTNTGLSKYESGQIKARKILKEVDATGLSGYDRKGQKTRATHLSNIDEFGRNGYRRQADTRLTTVLPNGLTVEQNAHCKQKETVITNNSTGSGGASKISKVVLTPIIHLLESMNIQYYFDKSEYGIKDPDTGNYYFYDLTITTLNMVIEYQSSAWHSNPEWNYIKWDKWKPPRGKVKSANESLEYDYNKARALYKHRGLITYYVWEDTANDDVERILCLLKTSNTKY